MDARPTIELTPGQLAAVQGMQAGFTRREIAAAQGVTPQAIKKQLSRGRKRAASLQRYGAALATPAGKPVRFRPFSLLPTDNV
jgi:IS30 family transposase